MLLCVGSLAVFMSGCGQTYKLDSISASPSTGYTLTSPGATGAITVTATFSNSKTSDVTLNSNTSYNIQQSPLFSPTVNTINPNPTMPIAMAGGPGTVQAITNVPGCSYAAVTSGGTTTYEAAPYTVLIKYTNDGITKQATVPIMVETESPCPPTS
jgi:hypothetical protein